MYKIMIVDDEVLARVGISALIPWEKHGFMLVGEAENGEKALDMAKKLHPDIIITDIRMPVLDGIELIKAMKRENFDTRFLVLSSYDDFEYVKEAMQNGADEYLLKLQLEPDKMLKALNALTEKLNKEREEKEKRQIVEKYYDVSIPLVKEKFLKDLVFKEAINSDEIEQRKLFLNINLPSRNLLCYVIHVEKSKVHQQYSDERLYLLNDSIITILDGVVSKYGCGYTINTEPMEFTIIYSLKEIYDEKLVHEHISQLASNIRQSMNTYLNTTVYIGVSSIHHGYESIKQAYTQAVKAANKAFSNPDKSAVRFSEVDDLSGEMDFKLLLDELADLESQLNMGDAEKVDQTIQKIKKSIAKSGGLSKEYLKRIGSVLFFVVNSYANKHNIHFDCLMKNEENLLTEIDKFNSPGQYIQWLTSIQSDIFEWLKNINDQKTIIVKAQRYILENYQNNISLKDVAEHLSLSSGYLSILYKKETGQNFIDYLIHLRMEKAKELLKTTELKIYEVAKKVGYDNIYYFSRIFSRVVGISPKQYQSNSRKVQK